jgi:small-conductance mechanosensitive channel
LDNEWTKTYSAYITHKNLIDRKNSIEQKIKRLKSLRSLTLKQKNSLDTLKKEYKVLEDKINLVKNFEKDPFKKLIAPPELNNAPKITNPFAIIGGLSYIKDLENKKNKYQKKYELLNDTISKLNRKRYILNRLYNVTKSQVDKEKLNNINNEIKQLLTIKDIFKTTKDIYQKKAEEAKLTIESDIKREFSKAAYIGGVALFFLIIFIGLKFLTRKYLSDKESYYTVNKVINIIFITIILITLLFAYLENVSYLITILGFASAGIAIAMKDWFMSLMGWFVIVIGGAIHVGDRVKFVRGNVEYVGDVVDISLLRLTIQEDVTLTTYTTNRRAGRIIFVPNNYIFTDMIANYSHSGLKTVWDGIDFYITFDSNIAKATTIAKNIAKQYSKGYTDITRKQLNKLRSKYQLKNTNVEPRVFSFIEGYGMKVSVWYLTNAYATLTLRSTISTKIIEELLQEDDIKLAYPTQSIYHDSGIPKPKELDSREVSDV